MPVLPVQLSYKHGPKTNRFDAVVDSGADDCLFRSDIGAAIGIPIEKAPKHYVIGVVDGQKIEVFYHHVNLWVGADMIRITAGFSKTMSVAALLGRRGFFENYIVQFDSSTDPPTFDIQRLGRA